MIYIDEAHVHGEWPLSENITASCRTHNTCERIRRARAFADVDWLIDVDDFALKMGAWPEMLVILSAKRISRMIRNVTMKDLEDCFAT